MGIRDWYRRDIRQNNDPPRLRFTNTAPFDDTPLGFFGEAVLDRLEKAGPTDNQLQRSFMFFQRVGTERKRNSMRWKYRLTEWITWKVPLFRRFYNTNVNEATGRLHRSITDPRNGKKYLLTSGGLISGRARKGWRKTQILDRHTGKPVDPDLQKFLQTHGVFLGRNTWNYVNQVGRWLSEKRDVGTERERECFRYIIMAHDNNSGPMEALEDGTDLYVRAFNSNGQWVLASQEVQDRLFTHGYAKYPHYSGDIMQFLNDAWARAGSDLVTQRRLLELQREAEFGEYAANAARDALQRDKWVTINYPGGSDGVHGPPPPSYGQSGTSGPHQPPPGPYYGGSDGGIPMPPPMPAGTPAYYGQAVGGDGGQQWVPQYDGPGYYRTPPQGHAAASPAGHGSEFNSANRHYAAQMAWMQQNPEQAQALVDSYNSMVGAMDAPGFTPGTGEHRGQAAPTSGAGPRAGASLDDRVWWTDAGRSGQTTTPRSTTPAGTAPTR